MSNEIKEKEEYEKYARDHRKELDAQEVRLGDVVTVLVGQFAGEKGVIVGISACLNDYSGPYYEVNMNCEVPEKYKCRKTLISPNNVIGGLSAHEFKVIGNCATKQPSMEIKVGDKVRVREDVPRMYLRTMSTKFLGAECGVFEIIDGNAAIASGRDYIAIPLKYLVKVEDEKKEAKFKVGDRVEELVSRKSGRVLGIEGDFVVVGFPYDKEKNYWHIDSVELVEPTEQTEAEEDARIRQKEAELEAFRKSELDRVLHPEKSHTYEVTVDNVAMDWQRYEADLAKEVALKVTNKYTDPKETAEYAVSVAKAVAEGLKRK